MCCEIDLTSVLLTLFLLVGLLVNLSFQFGIKLLSLLKLLLLYVASCSIHALLCLKLKLTLAFQLLNSFFNLRRNNWWVVLLVETILLFVCFFKVATLIVIAPANMAWRHVDRLLLFHQFKLLSFLLFETHHIVVRKKHVSCRLPTGHPRLVILKRCVLISHYNFAFFLQLLLALCTVCILPLID